MKNGIFAVVVALLACAALALSAQAASAAAGDIDGDGVADTQDACPNTPGLAQFQGCPPAGDRDMDGIGDYDDACPTIPGTDCPPQPDADHDGFFDILDACPGVAGVRQFQGCPPAGDRDMDGIGDYDDACPTIPGTDCPRQPDKDLDGVFDVLDVCEGTVGVILYQGCPPIASDDVDRDGLTDYVDPCPKSATNVCAPLPDADQDGVFDILDACRKTAGKAEFLGCPAPPTAPTAPAPTPTDTTTNTQTETTTAPDNGRGPILTAVPLVAAPSVSVNTRGTRLAITNVAQGSTVTVSCRGKGCPGRLKRAYVKRNAPATLKLNTLVKKPLRAGTVLTVSVVQPGKKAFKTTITFRRAKAPLVKTS